MALSQLRIWIREFGGTNKSKKLNVLKFSDLPSMVWKGRTASPR